MTTGRVRPLSAAHGLYLAAPLATAAVAYAVLATVRIAGAFQLGLAVLAIALTPCVLATVPRRSWSRIGLVRPLGRARLVRGCLVVFAIYALVAAGNVAVFGTGADNWMTGVTAAFESLFPGNPALWVPAMIVAMGVVIPLFEEVCYRGVLLAAVLGRYGPRWAVVVTSAGWALVHIGNYGLLPYNPLVIVGAVLSVFLMGLALGACRLITGSVWGSAIAQGSANLLMVTWVWVIAG
jgi:uncharacterized protein